MMPAMCSDNAGRPGPAHSAPSTEPGGIAHRQRGRGMNVVQRSEQRAPAAARLLAPRPYDRTQLSESQNHKHRQPEEDAGTAGLPQRRSQQGSQAREQVGPDTPVPSTRSGPGSAEQVSTPAGSSASSLERGANQTQGTTIRGANAHSAQRRALSKD